jgi:glycosyltransferase involved in cell wall biosynthesis
VLPARARRARLLLNPANLAPLAFPRNAVVIHDAAALRHPSWYTPLYARWQRAALPRIARRARVVITVSEFSRRELQELLDVDAHVVPGGVDPRFQPTADPEPAKAALGLTRPYVLTVASQIARKNLASLDALCRRLGDEGMELVAAGGDRPQFRTGRAGGGGPARPLGHVPDAYLPGLYAGASAFVLPSWHEGFGLTCLEAMACGVPVVAANAGALPETCGEAARYADPGDPEAIATQVLQAVGDEALRAKGPHRAASFTWERTTRELHALLSAA